MYIDNFFGNKVKSVMSGMGIERVYVEGGQLKPKDSFDAPEYAVSIDLQSSEFVMIHRSHAMSSWIVSDKSSKVLKYGNRFKSAWIGSMILGYNPAFSYLSREIFWYKVSSGGNANLSRVDGGRISHWFNHKQFCELDSSDINMCFVNYMRSELCSINDYVEWADYAVSTVLGVTDYSKK